MELKSLRFFLVALFLLAIFSAKRSNAQVVFTGIAGNASTYLAQGNTNQVVYGFSMFVPAGGTFSPTQFHIAVSTNVNGFVSGSLYRTTTGVASTATSGTNVGSLNINSTLDIGGLPTYTGAAGTGTTYYFWVVLSVTTTANPRPGATTFSLPTTAAAISQNTYSGGTTINNIASPTTYYFYPPPIISYATPQTYTQNVAITTLSPTSTGGTITSYSATLPAGLSISSSTGAITGIPTVVSTATNYTVTATGNGGPATAIVNITVNPPVPIISYATPQNYTQNVAISTLSPSSTGGPVATYTAVTTLPLGLSISSSTGAITGTPSVLSSATNYTIKGTNAGGSATTIISIAVLPPAPTVPSVTQCGAGETLTASGGSPAGGTYNWYVVATGGTAVQSSTLTTLTNILSTTTYYVSYTSGGVESLRTPVTATVNPIAYSPIPGALFMYPFNGNTNDVSGMGNTAIATYQTAAQTEGTSTSPPTLCADRFGTANSAYNFDGLGQYMNTTTAYNSPAVFTISMWFKTTTTVGGKLIGFDHFQGPSSGQFDRHIYMTNAGTLIFGVYNSSTHVIISPKSYNDGTWHHVVVTFGPTYGSVMYVDDVSVASNSTFNAAEPDVGYWRIGGDLCNGWTSTPTSYYFAGQIDDIGVYGSELTSTQVAATDNLCLIGTSNPTCSSSGITLYPQNVTGATFKWTDPAGNTSSTQNATFTPAITGNYTLLVTGGPGGCSSTATVPVTVTTVSSTFTAPAAIFTGSNATITYTGSDPSTDTYAWSFGTGSTIVSGSGQGPYVVNWSSAGSKTVSLTLTSSTTSCTSTSTQTVTVNSGTTTYGNYAYRKTITLNTQAVGITSTLTNFPMLVSIKDTDLVVSGKCSDKVQNPTGPNYDLAFTDPSAPTTELYYQVESYNSTTGTLLVWVQMPSVNSASNNQISFYYGSKNPTITHNTAFFQKTWGSDYQAVYHFAETAYSATTADGTANNRTATLVGFTSSDYVAAGKIGSCYTFGGTSGSSTANDMEAAATPASSTFTLSAWVNTTNIAADEKIITDQDATGTTDGGYKLGVYFDAPETEGDGYLNRSYTPNPSPLTANTWYYVQGVYDGTTLSTYVNGVQYKQEALTATTTFTNILYIGIGEGKNFPFNGMIDEPRVSNIAKSSDWIKMEYYNQNAPLTFCSISTTPTVNTTYAAAILGGMVYTWKGAASTATSNLNNWDCTTSGTLNQLPPFDGSATLVIPAGLTNYPSLSAAGSLYGLIIASGASFNLNGYVLSVGCHIYNGSGGQILYGTTSTAGGITFNGSLATQYYYGTTTGVASVANLTVNNSAAGTVDITGGAFGVSNILTLTSGNLFIDNTNSGSLTLLSTATNSASVAAIPSAYNITGNVNVQRFITSGAGTRGYRLLTSPVNVNSSITGTGSLGLTYLNTNATFNSTTYYGAYTQGPGTGFTFNGSVHPIIYLYDQSQATYNGSFTGGKNIGVYTITGSAGSPAYGVITQGTSIATSAVNIPIANSYLLYFVGSDQSSVVSGSRAPDATTLTATGYLNQGNVPFVFWKTASASLPYNITTGTSNYGLFQVGNPYPSTISLATLYTDNYNSSSNAISPSFYELIPTGNYVSYNASNGHVSDTRASQYIVSGQGFLAQTTVAGQTITFKEDQKVAYSSSNPFLESISGPALADAHIINSIPSKSKSRTDAFITSPVSDPGNNTGLHVQMTMDSTTYAQTGIYFSSNASDKYLPSEDAVEIDGGTPLVYLSSYSSDSVKLSINTMGDYGYGKHVRLYANAVNSGVYTMSLADIANIDTTNYGVYLIDNKMQDSTDIVHYKTYTFNLNTADTTTFGSNRFVLSITHKPVAQYALATFTGQKVTSGVQLKWTAVNAGTYTGYTLQKLNSTGGYDSLYSVQSDTTVTAYSYIDTHPVMGSNVYRLKQNGFTGAITYSAVVTIGYSSTTPNGALTLYPNPAQSILNVNLTSNTINASYVADIYNSLGVKVNHQTVTGATWTNDVSAYKLGVYIMEIKDGSGNIIGLTKFVKAE